MPPSADQIEVTLFGPGYGESALIHLGGGHWIIADSCIDNVTHLPAALSYLETIGIDPGQAVRLVVATHWHNDHIGGMRTVVSRCTSAKFCCAWALPHPEFLSMVRTYEKRSMISGGAGVREINEVFEILRGRNEQAKYAGPNRVVDYLESTKSGHGEECSIWTLSPSDQQCQKFLYGLTALMPKVGQTKYRCVSQTPNELSVVTWIKIGKIEILLGGDLEESSSGGSGWSVIVSSAERPQGKASIFKIPHHGSANAHNAAVWKNMLIGQPYAILTPWNRGSKLPTHQDVERIHNLTRNAYSSAKLRLPRVRKRAASIERTLRESGVELRRAEPTTGAIRLRNGGNSGPANWEVTLFKEACHITDVHSVH